MTQDVNCTYIRRSEYVLNFFWRSLVRSIYVLCSGGKLIVEDCKIFSYSYSFYLKFWRCASNVIILPSYDVKHTNLCILWLPFASSRPFLFVYNRSMFNLTKAPIIIFACIRWVVSTWFYWPVFILTISKSRWWVLSAVCLHQVIVKSYTC